MIEHSRWTLKNGRKFDVSLKQMLTSRKALLLDIEWLEQDYLRVPESLDINIYTTNKIRFVPPGFRGDSQGFSFIKLDKEESLAARGILLSHQKKALAKLDAQIEEEFPDYELVEQSAGECPECRGCLVSDPNGYKCMNCDRVFSEEHAQRRGAVT